MDKLVIFEDTVEINKRVNRGPVVLEVVQSLYDKLNSNGLVTSFDSVKEVFQSFASKSRHRDGQGHLTLDQEKYVTELMKNTLLDSTPDGLTINGIKMNRAKVLDLIQIDELAVQEFISLFNSFTPIDVHLLCFLQLDAVTHTINLQNGYADIIKATKISIDSKIQYPSDCNAVETILVHKNIAINYLP